MAWVRIEDTVTEHRKHLAAGPAACWLWVCGIAYCQRQLSDGFIPLEALPMLGVASGVKGLTARLVRVGLFDVAEGGYLVHDYHHYNDTRAEAFDRRLKLSKVRSDAGRIGGLHSAATRKANAEAKSKQSAKQVAEANRSPDPTHPIPEELSAAASPRSALTEAPNANGNYRVIEKLAADLSRAGYWELQEGVRFEITCESELVHAVKDLCAQKRIDYGRHPDVAQDVVHRACASVWCRRTMPAARRPVGVV